MKDLKISSFEILNMFLLGSNQAGEESLQHKKNVFD